MKPIPFRANPGFVNAGESLGLAGSHLAGNPALWAIPAAVYAIVSGGATYALSRSITSDLSSLRGDPQMARAFLDTLGARWPSILGAGLLLLLGGIAIAWFAYAIAVGGLPGRQMTLDTAMSAGLRTIVLGVLAILAILAATILIVALSALVIRAGAGLLLLLVIPAAFVAFCYVSIRLAFTPFAVFDGAGVIDAIRASWVLSRGAMLRILGWLIMLFAIALAVSVATSVLQQAFGAVALLAILISAALTTTLQFFQTVVLAILYESERVRHSAAHPRMPGGGQLPFAPGVAIRADTPIPGSPSPDPLLPPPPPR